MDLPVIQAGYMWQSWVENEHYPVAYFNYVAVFKVLYQFSVRVGLICVTRSLVAVISVATMHHV